MASLSVRWHAVGGNPTASIAIAHDVSVNTKWAAFRFDHSSNDFIILFFCFFLRLICVLSDWRWNQNLISGFQSLTRLSINKYLRFWEGGPLPLTWHDYGSRSIPFEADLNLAHVYFDHQWFNVSLETLQLYSSLSLFTKDPSRSPESQLTAARARPEERAGVSCEPPDPQV